MISTPIDLVALVGKAERGSMAPDMADFGIEEVSEMLRRVGAAPGPG